MRRKLVLLGIALSFALTACGQKGSASVAEDYGNTSDEREDTTSLKTTMGVDKEVWTKSIACNGKTINIDATIVVPETDHMGVVAVQPVKMDADYRKEVLPELCDSGEVYVLDKENPPKWYVETMCVGYDGMLEAFGEVWFEEDELEIYNSYKEMLSSGVSNPEKASKEYKENTYYGKMQDKQVVFCFDQMGCDLSWAPLSPMHTLQWLNKEGEGGIQVGSTPIDGAIGNESKMTMEEAITYCDNVLKQMQLTDYEVKTAQSLQWQMEDMNTSMSEIWTEGYYIYYTLVVDSVQSEEMFSGGIDFRITDEGIVEAYFMNPYAVKEAEVEQPGLLPFSKVQGVLVDVLSEKADKLSFNGSDKRYDKLELQYYPQSEGDETVMIPVWILSDSSSNDCVIINAIDGAKMN